MQNLFDEKPTTEGDAMKLADVKGLISLVVTTAAAQKAVANARSLRELKIILSVSGLARESTKVFLCAVGENKIGVIKAVREITGLGLKEAKDLADAAQISERLVCEVSGSAHHAESLLKAAGATVRIEN